MPQKKTRSISAEDLYRFDQLSGVNISPDGNHIIYSVQRIDRKKEKKYTNLWIVPTYGGKTRQFTWGDHSDTAPAWSPDGKTIAFLSNRMDKDSPPRIFIIPFSGGEARPLTNLQASISMLRWSPDGKTLLCQVRKMDTTEIERRKDEQKKKLGVVYRHYDRVFYKLDGYGYLPEERTHLWVIDAQTGKGRQITDHPVWDEAGATWSPDGKWIAFISNRSSDPDLNPDLDDLFVISANGKDLRKIPTPVGMKMHPKFSPDGKYIAYAGREGVSDWYKNIGLWIVPIEGSNDPVDLLQEYDLHFDASTINDVSSPETMPPNWSTDSNHIFFQTVYHGSTMLMSISRDGKELKTIVGEGGVVAGYELDTKQKNLAYLYGQMQDPAQIYVKNISSGDTRQLTHHNSDLFNSIDLGEVEELWVDGKANNRIQGWILKPPGFDPRKKYPSILEIHGGPLTQYGWFFMHEFYYLAAAGYVVHFCNPRGGRGYGEKHAGAIWGGWGDADYEDLMAWTDKIATLPYIDSSRMGVTGGSYGGYMTVWIIGHTPRFKAAVTQRCVSNFISMWGSSDFNWSFQQVLDDKPPFDDLQKFWEHSPMKFIGNAKTPTLVIHSEMDLRCPIEQGEQVFVALKRLGVASEMVRFPDEFHGLSRGGRTDRRIKRLEHIRGWFDRYLK